MLVKCVSPIPIRYDNIIYVHPGDPLQTIVNTFTNKILCLEAGVYKGPIYIGANVNNLTIKSMSKWGAILDGGNADYTIKLDNTSNICVKDIIILNGTYGLSVKNCNECTIEHSKIRLFREDGIHMYNSSGNTITYIPQVQYA